MKFVVLNGSPKGDDSVTLQYTRYMFKHHREHEMEVFHVAKHIYAIEKSDARLDAILGAIQEADGVIWSFPVYTMAVSAQLKRFIELCHEEGGQGVFQGKYTAAVATSVHFFDHTAINYIHGICDDWHMHYVGGFSAHMGDLQEEEGQKRLLAFAMKVFTTARAGRLTRRTHRPIQEEGLVYHPSNGIEPSPMSGKKLILVDAKSSANVLAMVDQLKAAWNGSAQVVFLKDIGLTGDCMGCLQCGFESQCLYDGKDPYREFFETQVREAGVIVFAGAIKDRFLSAQWKRFFDRGFYCAHEQPLAGKQTAMLISGPLQQLPNLQEVFEGYFQTQGSHFHGFVSDEWPTSEEIDRRIEALVHEMAEHVRPSYSPARTFLGEGAKKVIRDEIQPARHYPKFLHHLPGFRKDQYQTRMTGVLVQTLKQIVEG